MLRFIVCLLLAVGISACGKPQGVGGNNSEASPATLEANARFAKTLPLDDPQAFEDSARGLVAQPKGKILAADGSVLIDFEGFNFVDGPAPDTVNPSLWRHAKLNKPYGLFKVREGIHQLRGFDISNMTLIDGEKGWIVVDPLTATEVASAAIAFAREHLGNKPVTAVIYTHSHIDHFGGVRGVLDPQDAKARKVPIVAPAGFMEEATSENVMVGVAMGRRSGFQFGKNLERSPKGFVDAGLGKNLAYGTFSIIAPTHVIERATETLTLDGVAIEFINTPNTEAPSEMVFNIPSMKAFCGAELMQHTLHNFLPIRGAKVRDSLGWSRYMDGLLDKAQTTDVYFVSHTWPVWGSDRIQAFIRAQRDAYRYLHDQTVRLMNAGYTPREIADQIQLPSTLAKEFSVRGYYGDIRHNVKAIYQHYLGFYDGNPANLNPLAPAESAKRWVNLVGADKALSAAQKAFDEGDFRWAAELLNHLVFTDGGHRDAQTLLAKTYDQMAYMAESATWRNTYLTAAAELRNGPPTKGVNRANFTEVLTQTPIERFLDAMGAALNGPAADGKTFRINLVLTDIDQSYLLWVENAVLHHRRQAPASDAQATLSLTHAMFIRMMAGAVDAGDFLTSPDIKVTGNRLDLIRFLGLLDKAEGIFPIVTAKD